MIEANKITDLILHEVSLVERGANDGARLALFKSYNEEQPKEPNMELEKQIEELTAKNLELQKSLDEAVTIEKEEVAITKEETDDPRVLKLLEASEASKLEASVLRKEMDEFKLVQLNKEVTEQVLEHAEIFKSDEEQAKAVDILKSVDAETRDFFLGNLAKSVTILKEASDVIEQEIGKSGGEDVTVNERVQLEADELVKSDGVSIYKARATIIAKLSTEDKDAYEKGAK